jgi:hypothetical protein
MALSRGLDFYLVALISVVAVMVQWVYAWKAGFKVPAPGTQFPLRG